MSNWRQLVGAAAILAACGGGDGSGPSPPVPLRIVVSTAGAPADPDGYQVLLDGQSVGSLGLDDTLVLPDVAAGYHTVFLTGIAATCWPDVDNLEVITLSGSREKTWRRTIHCEPLPSALRGKLAFDRTPPGSPGSEIFIMNLDGTGQTSLTPHPGQDYGDAVPRISPDGRFLVFLSNRAVSTGIYRIRSDGRGSTRLTPSVLPASDCSWSPNGQKIAFSSWDFFSIDDIFTVNLDGTGITQITSLKASHIGASWSPDGQEVAFWTDRDIDPNVGGGTQLYAVKVATGAERRLSFDLTAGHGQPTWAPDGQSLAYFRNDLDPNTHEYMWRIWRMNREGGSVTRLTSPVLPDRDYSPAWSPDGTRIAFVRSGSIHVMQADGSGIAKVVTSPSEDGSPAWSP